MKKDLENPEISDSKFTQDDTFRILRQRPFEEVYDKISKKVNILDTNGSIGTDISGILEILEEDGWIVEEVIDHLLNHKLP